MNKFDKLKGAKLYEIHDRDDSLCFRTEKGEITFSAEGDCCSQSWIEHFDKPTEECTIIEFKQIEIPPSFDYPETKTDNEQDCMKYYFYELLTDKGSFLVEMRNSSNGYYGGSLE